MLRCIVNPNAGQRHKVFRPAILLAAYVLICGVQCRAAAIGGDPCTNPALPANMAADCSAQSIAAAVDRHYNALKSLRVEFTQQYAGMGMNRKESGTLLLKKPGKMRWTYAHPAGKLFLLDGKYAYFYAPGDPQIQRVPARQLDDLRSPLRFLLGHTQLAKEMNGLTATHVGPPGVAGGQMVNAQTDAYWLSGVPKGMEKRVERMTLRVDRNGVIYQIQVDEVDGAQTIFTLTGEQPNAPAPDAEFVFHAPSGVPIVDAMPPV